MGGCATKPKVLKDDPDVKVKAPEPEPEPEPQPPPKVEAVVETKVPEETSSQPQHVKSVEEIKVPHEPQREVNTVVDDDQINKQRSLPFVNNENDDTKASTENEKTEVEKTVKQETLEPQKPLEDNKSNEPIVKEESSKPEKNEVVNNEPAKQDSPLIEPKEKSPVQNNTNKPEELVKSEPKVEKVSEENQIKEPLKQEFVDAKDTPLVETKNNEPIKESPLFESSKVVQVEGGKTSDDSKDEKSETLNEETKKVVPQPEEKVIEALSTDAGSVPKIITEEATFSSKEKNHNEVEHPTKVAESDKIET